MKRRHWRQLRSNDPAELNITAFMNLMVILVPFLLITAVFSRMAIVQLNLPGAVSEAADNQPEFSLEVIIRDKTLTVSDRSSGPLKTFKVADDDYPLEQLSEFLRQIKARFPDKLEAAILLEPDVPYDTLVQVMDHVRSYEADNDGQRFRAELFPQVSVGDAPVPN